MTKISWRVYGNPARHPGRYGKVRRKALVTGATGFVGSHLTRKLLSEGWEVHILLRDKSDTQKLNDLQDKIQTHRSDGRTTTLVQIFQQAKPDVVFHLASRVQSGHRPEEIEDLVSSNITLGTQLLEGMLQSGTRYFVNAGSYWQYFESGSYNPVNFYAATKQAFQDLLRFYTETSSISALTLVLYDVYGPEDTRNKLFQLVETASQSGEPLAMTPGEQYLDLVYIDDVVEAFCQAARLLQTNSQGDREECYAVTSGRPLRLKEVVAIYQRVTGKTVPVVWGKRPYRNREVMRPWKGTPLPGWKAGIDLETGIQRMTTLSRMAS